MKKPTDMNNKTLKADFHVTKEQFEALKNADIIRLTNGQEYIKKEIFESELRRLRKELQKEPIQLDIDPVQVAIDVYCNTPRWPYPKTNGNL